MTTPSVALSGSVPRTKLNRQQIVGFWAAWSGWLLDGMDSVIYALVLAPALNELLPRSGIDATPARVGYVGSILFAAFLAGWGFSFLWGPIADRFGRTRALAATILVYALFTGAAAFAQNVWQLGLFRFLAGVGVGGEWAMAGHVRRRGVARRSSKDGSGLPADRLLLRILRRGGAQLHRRRALRLAGDVSLRLRAGDRVRAHASQSEGARALDEARGRREARTPARRDLWTDVSPADDRECDAAHCGDHRPVGRRGVRARRDHDAGEKGRYRRSGGGEDWFHSAPPCSRSARSSAASVHRCSPSGGDAS